MTELPPFSTLPTEAVAVLLGQNGAYADLRQQDGEVIDGRASAADGVSCYEDFLSLLVRRIFREAALGPQKGADKAVSAASPRLRKDTNELTSALDRYIREWMFGEPFDPPADDGWRLLLLPHLTAHIVRLFTLALPDSTRKRIAQAVRTRHGRDRRSRSE